MRMYPHPRSAPPFFECAHDSTNSPVAAWVISAVYVALTAVLLLNMLIAMCAACHQPSNSKGLALSPYLTFTLCCVVCCPQDGQDL